MGLQVDVTTRRMLGDTVLSGLASRTADLGLELRVARLQRPETLKSPTAPTLAWSPATSDDPFAWVFDTGVSRQRSKQDPSAEPSLGAIIEKSLEYLFHRPLVLAAGGVVLAETSLASGVILVAEPNIARPGTVRWRLPKGLVDDGETAEEAARREVREETGIDAEVIRAAGTASWAYLYDGTEMVKQVEFFVLRALRRVGDTVLDEVVSGHALFSPGVAVAALHFDSERDELADVFVNSGALEMGTPKRSVLGGHESLNDLQRPVVSVIVERLVADGLEILLQRRRKPTDPFDGALELPQGKIERGESILRSARRELLEETGMHLSSLRDAEGTLIADSAELHSFVPLTCVLDPLNNHVGMVLVGTASGEARPTQEGTDHSWIPVKQLRSVIRSGQVFPLNVAMLEAYLYRYGMMRKGTSGD